MEFEIGNFIGERQKNGTFLYKSKEFTPLKKKAKSSYKDLPQFPIVGTVEEEFKKVGRTMIEKTGIDIIKYLKTLE